MIDENIQAVRSAGGEGCFVCEKPIARGAPSVRVTFGVVVVVKISKTVEAHADPCAKELSALIDLRVRQAQRIPE